MTKINQNLTDYDKEIEKIDEAISACKRDFEELLYKRHVFIARKFGIDVMDLIEYVSKSDDVPQEAVDLIVSIVKKKREQQLLGWLSNSEIQ